MNLSKTIAAISTPMGSGGISIIRLSGADAISIADKIFISSSGMALSKVPTHTINHGKIISLDGEVVDEVLVSVMRAPKTYTGEDIVEINCHGGLLVTNLVLEEVLRAGAVSATRGEFTKRAFLNGKLDLAKAEAVIDLINSKTELEQGIAVNHLGGHLSEKINSARESLLELIAHVQVLIDYPDEELEPLSEDEFLQKLKSVYELCQKLYESAAAGSIIKDGIDTAIVGKPNVGKSSLLNLLSGKNKAIVTDIEGTTRDAIEERVSVGGITLNLTDTAGIRQTADTIEAMGVERSREYIEKSSLIIFMADAISGLDGNDYEIIELLKGRCAIALINKSEGASLQLSGEHKSYFKAVINFSVKTEEGLGELEAVIKEQFALGQISKSSDIITSVRHRDALQKAAACLLSAIDAIESGISADTTFIDIEEAISSLGEIVGLTVSEEVVDKIFHSFCVGK